MTGSMDLAAVNGDAGRITPVILAGGAGSRLWPLSRELSPKQLLSFDGGTTLLHRTISRCAGSEMFDAPIIVSSEAYRFAIAQQAAAVGLKAFTQVLEPAGRSTAPAAALAALVAVERNAEAILLVAPADHVVQDIAGFRDAISRGIAAARRGLLVTFGVQPRSPHTGYGYIESGDPIEHTEVLRLRKFVEKPSQAGALALLETGRYLWNSGIFLMSAGTYIAELSRHAPEMMDLCRQAMSGGRREGDAYSPDEAPFRQIVGESIDVAVMERTDRGAVLPVDFGWSDLGAWSSVWDIASKDPNGNARMGDVAMVESSRSYGYSSGPLTVLSGVQDIVVVVTDDAVLVTTRDRAEDVKGIVADLRSAGRPEALSHRKVDRPWGYYQSLHVGDRFQVKRLTVAPGEKLSLQKHHHRAEHWVVVNGTAIVTCDDEVKLLHENESAYIPLGAVHRLENPGKVPLNLIEVQSGGYLGEDDIVRIEDTYGRVRLGSAEPQDGSESRVPAPAF